MQGSIETVTPGCRGRSVDPVHPTNGESPRHRPDIRIYPVGPRPYPVGHRPFSSPRPRCTSPMSWVASSYCPRARE